MAEKRFAKGSEEWVILQEYYKLCTKVWIIEDSDEYWDDVRKSVDSYIGKFKADIFAKQLAFALLNTLEEKEKERRENETICTR